MIDKQIKIIGREVGQRQIGLVDGFGLWLRFLGNRLKTFDEKLALVDPNLRLKQGYSLVFGGDGKIVRSAESLVLGDELDITFFRGKTKSKIIKISKQT